MKTKTTLLALAGFSIATLAAPALAATATSGIPLQINNQLKTVVSYAYAPATASQLVVSPKTGVVGPAGTAKLTYQGAYGSGVINVTLKGVSYPVCAINLSAENPEPNATSQASGYSCSITYPHGFGKPVAVITQS